MIGAEVTSPFVDWDDRNTAVLFGDGAGAVVLRRARARRDSWRSGSAATPRRAASSTSAASGRGTRTSGSPTATPAGTSTARRSSGAR